MNGMSVRLTSRSGPEGHVLQRRSSFHLYKHLPGEIGEWYCVANERIDFRKTNTPTEHRQRYRRTLKLAARFSYLERSGLASIRLARTPALLLAHSRWNEIRLLSFLPSTISRLPRMGPAAQSCFEWGQGEWWENMAQHTHLIKCTQTP